MKSVIQLSWADLRTEYKDAYKSWITSDQPHPLDKISYDPLRGLLLTQYTAPELEWMWTGREWTYDF